MLTKNSKSGEGEERVILIHTNRLRGVVNPLSWVEGYQERDLAVQVERAGQGFDLTVIQASQHPRFLGRSRGCQNKKAEACFFSWPQAD